MALWRDGGFVEDEWTSIGDDAELGARPAIVSLARYKRDAMAEKHVGVALTAGQEALDALPGLVKQPLIALNFAAFGDGRAFSYAILLRQRLGFRGQLRAVGDVLIDEIPLMLRCGFDAFDVSNEATLRALREGGPPRFPLAYQPGFAPETREPSRPWARRLA